MTPPIMGFYLRFPIPVQIRHKDAMLTARPRALLAIENPATVGCINKRGWGWEEGKAGRGGMETMQ